jgi:hypothetical protein
MELLLQDKTTSATQITKLSETRFIGSQLSHLIFSYSFIRTLFIPCHLAFNSEYTWEQKEKFWYADLRDKVINS